MKVAIIHPWLKTGGSEARALWAVQALKGTCEVTLITGGGADFERLNAYYGACLLGDDFRVLEGGVPNWMKKLSIGDALRGAVFNRWLRRNIKDYDLVISTYNLIDVPVPTIQFIADFSWDDAERRRLHPEQGWRGFLHGDNLFRRLYLAGVNWLSGGRSVGEILQNRACTVSNSRFSAGILKAKYGVESRIIYPPVVGDFPDISWKEKKQRVVTIGRISPEKELEKVIAIIDQVRGRGHDIELVVIGDWQSSSYGRELHRQAEKKGPWLCFMGDCRGEIKNRLLAESRYGIHGRIGEAFGIAVAEMLKAGCIPFVPEEGGPNEIVEDSRLVYSQILEAVDKIDRALSSNSVQEELRLHLNKQGRKFSEKTFMAAVRDLVAECSPDNTAVNVE